MFFIQFYFSTKTSFSKYAVSKMCCAIQFLWLSFIMDILYQFPLKMEMFYKY